MVVGDDMDTDLNSYITLRRTRCGFCGHVITRKEVAKRVVLRRIPDETKEIAFLFQCAACSSISELAIVIPPEIPITTKTPEFRALVKLFFKRNFVCEASAHEQIYLEELLPITEREVSSAMDTLDSPDWLTELQSYAATN